MECVCVGLRKINFDDMGLQSGENPSWDSLDKKCSELGLQGPARVKGWDTREKVLPVCQRGDPCVPCCTCAGSLCTPKEAGEAIGTGNVYLIGRQLL